MSTLEQCVAGDRIPELERVIELSSLVRYAGASGDFNPIHYDDGFARAAGLDGIIGHGALAMALVAQAVTDWLGDSGLLQTLNVRFASPYQLGDRLTVGGEVVARIDDEPGPSHIELRLSCVNDKGVEIIRNASATVLSR